MPDVGDLGGQTIAKRPMHIGVGGPVQLRAKDPVRRTRCLNDPVGEFGLIGNFEAIHPISGHLRTVIEEFSRRTGAARLCQPLAQKRASTARTCADQVN